VFYIDVAKVDRDVAHFAMVFSSVCPKCFVCFRRMLQVLHLDVVKVDSDVALHVASVCSNCFRSMFHSYVASVLSSCCICFTMATNVFPWCFIRTLQVF
jgi:hypothetical protein